MSDPIPTVRDILGFPDAPVTPIRPTQPAPAVRFSDAHGDDIQHRYDETHTRQLVTDLIPDDDSPNPWDIA